MQFNRLRERSFHYTGTCKRLHWLGNRGVVSRLNTVHVVANLGQTSILLPSLCTKSSSSRSLYGTSTAKKLSYQPAAHQQSAIHLSSGNSNYNASQQTISWEQQGQQVHNQRRQQQRSQPRNQPPPPKPPPQPNELTHLISECSSWQQLQSFCAAQQQRLNFIHASAIITKLAKLTGPNAGVHQAEHRRRKPGSTSNVPLVIFIGHIALLVSQHASEFGARAVANSIWAAAKLVRWLDSQHPTSPGAAAERATSLSHLTALLQQLLAEVPTALQYFEPQHLSNIAYALAVLHAHGSIAPVLPAGNARAQPVPDAATSAAFSSLGSSIAAAQLDHSQLMALVLAAARLCLRQFAPQGLSNLAYAIAVTGFVPDPEWMDEFVDAASLLLPTFEPQHVSNSLWALARLGYYPGDEWMEMALEAAAWKLPVFTPQGLSNLLWSLAYLSYAPAPPVLSALLVEVARQAGEFGPQDHANTLWALAKLYATCGVGRLQESQQDAAAVPPMGPSNADDQLSSPKPVAITSPAYPVADDIAGSTGGSSSSSSSSSQACSLDPTWHHCATQLLACTPQQLQGFSFQQLSNTLWALSVLQLRPAYHGWYASFLAASINLLHTAKPQELSSMAVACARLGLEPGGAWWEQFFLVSQPLLPDFEAQHVSNVLWAVGRAGRRPAQDWTTAMLLQIRKHLDQGTLTLQAVVCIMWAFGKLRLQPGPVFDKLAATAAAAGPALGLQGLSMVLWACGQLRYQLQQPMMGTVLNMFWMSLGPEGVAAMEGGSSMPTGLARSLGSSASAELQPMPSSSTPASPPSLGLADPQVLSTVVWTLARLQLRPKPALMAAITRSCFSQLHSFSGHALATLMWAFVMLGYQPGPKVVTSVEAHAQDLLGTLTARDFAMLVWSMARMGHQPRFAWLVQLSQAWPEQAARTEVGQGKSGHQSLSLGTGERGDETSSSRSDEDMTAAMLKQAKEHYFGLV